MLEKIKWNGKILKNKKQEKGKKIRKAKMKKKMKRDKTYKTKIKKITLYGEKLITENASFFYNFD